MIAAWWWWLGLAGLVLMVGAVLLLLAIALRAPLDTEVWDGGEDGYTYGKGAP